MNWLVTGAGGMLGTDLVAALRHAEANVVAYTRSELDVRDATAVREVMQRHRPTTVVNCAAWTAVYQAEAQEDAALQVNGTAVSVLAGECADHDAAFVHVSTDYVFGGHATEPYQEDTPPAPVNAYGRTKLAGERVALAAGRAYVLRTAWLYGAHGHNFVRTMIRMAREREAVYVVDDQTGQPTWTGDLAERILTLSYAQAPPGIYHATAAGCTTWYGLAREIFALLGQDPGRVRPASSTELPQPVLRPAWSVLGHEGWARAGLPPMRHWRTALHAAWPVICPGCSTTGP